MSALDFLQTINQMIGLLFLVCYAYQLLYVPVALWRRHQVVKSVPPRRYAVLISARNEEAVIAQLIDSIKNQDYPSEMLSIFVVADNCTDSTAQVASEAGATVWQRKNLHQIGKGYALNFLLTHIREEYGDDTFDGYFVFDADNLLAPDYVARMNEVFSQEHQIVTSYRNSKNYGDNWISAGVRDHGWQVDEVDYDGHNATDLAIKMCQERNNEDFCVEVAQTCAGQNLAVKGFRELLLQGKIVIEESPLLMWCLANAIEVQNNYGDIKLSKKHKDDTERIDPVAAVMNALARVLVKRENPPDLNDALERGDYSM